MEQKKDDVFRFSLHEREGCRHEIFVQKKANASDIGCPIGGIAVNDSKKSFAIWVGSHISPIGMKTRGDVTVARSRKQVVQLARQLKSQGYSEGAFEREDMRPYTRRLSDFDKNCGRGY